VSRRLAAAAISILLPAAVVSAQPQKPPNPAETTGWFRATEQKLMDAITRGDRKAWEEVTDQFWVLTDEEGRLWGRNQFLDELRPLPQGVTGDISVQDLTVQPLEDIAVVRFLADEWQTVFGQRISTRYRVTDVFRRDREGWKMVSSHVSVATHDPPAQDVSRDQWPSFAGTYRLLPDGWIFTVELRDGLLHGGRDPKKLRPLIPVAPNVFVLSGSLGEWIFVADKGAVTHVVSFRKLEPLVWTRVEASAK
jgi:hypothetical protein